MMSFVCLVFVMVADISARVEESFFCREECDGGSTWDRCISSAAANGCLDQQPRAGCHLFAWETFHDDEICMGFLNTNPICDSSCTEASSYQLAFDLDREFHRTYEVNDFEGLAHTFYHAHGAFVPAQFLPEDPFVTRSGFAQFYERWTASGAKATDRVPKLVMSLTEPADNSTSIVHEIGIASSSATVRYTKWIWGDDVHVMAQQTLAGQMNSKIWQIETEVIVADGTVSMTDNTHVHDDPIDPLIGLLKTRYQTYADYYGAKKFHALVSEMYSQTGLIVPRDGSKFVSRSDMPVFLSGMYEEDSARTFVPLTVNLSPDGTSLHEVGNHTTAHGSIPSYTRWRLEDGKWKIEMHLFAEAAASEARPAFSV